MSDLQLDNGSDCPTGKAQFVSKEVADGSAKAGRVRGWHSLYAYRCQLCQCWHVGNRRAFSSKSRGRR
jgi:hypothetical protein